MRRYDLVIFDFDGTLADSAEWFFDALNEAARRFGFRQVLADEAESYRLLSSREILARLEVSWWKLPRIARWMRARARADSGRIALFPGVPEALGALRAQGVRLAIVSSNDEAHIRAVLGPELAGSIDAWGCGSSLFGKARVLRRLLRRERVPGARALYVGDEMRDMDAARAAGLAGGAVLWGYAAESALALARPARAFRAVDELTRLSEHA